MLDNPDQSWSFACPDWEARLRAGRLPIPDLPLDEASAERAVRVFDNLRLPDVAGQPYLRDAAGQWFRDLVRVIFGSVIGDPNTNPDAQRLVGEVFALVPKKNSKTTYAAALALTWMLINTRRGAEVLLVAPTKDIADLCFGQVSGMIDTDEEGWLPQRFHVAEHSRTITCRVTKAKLKVKAFDARVLTGARPAVVILDEMHVLSANSRADKILGDIRGARQANAAMLFVTLTTQSVARPSGVFKRELKYARAVRDGRLPSRLMLPVLYEFPEEMQRDKAQPWADPVHWPMVQPNLGRSVTIKKLTEGWAEAQDKGEEEARRWASQHLNVQIGIALHADRWIGADFWEDAARPGTLEEIIEGAEVCTVGIDGGGLDDLLGLAVIGRMRETGDWRLWARAWAKPVVLERRPEIAPQLQDFSAAGDLVICETPTQDVEEVADIVEDLWQRCLLPERSGIGVDSSGIMAVLQKLQDRNIKEPAVVAVPQGYKLAEAIWGVERKLHDGTLTHLGQSLMTWCVGNAKAEPKGNAVLITKETAGRAKIDPLVAAFMAAMLMGRGPQPRESLDVSGTLRRRGLL